MVTTAHIPYSTLADFAEGRATPGWLASAHLAECPRCTADLAWLTRTIGLMRSDRAELPPAHVTARAKRLFQRPAPGAGLRRRLHAWLQFDSAQAPLAFGLRSAGGGARQLLFDAGDYTIDLRLNPAGEQLSLRGQVLGPDAPGSVELRGESARQAATLSNTNSFSMPQVQPGIYTLTFSLESVDITIPDLQLE